jgi:hypothetical protein
MAAIFTTAQLAARYGLKPAAIYGWRHRGYGPKVTPVGRQKVYREEDVLEWEKSNSKAPVAKAS